MLTITILIQPCLESYLNILFHFYLYKLVDNRKIKGLPSVRSFLKFMTFSEQGVVSALFPALLLAPRKVWSRVGSRGTSAESVSGEFSLRQMEMLGSTKNRRSLSTLGTALKVIRSFVKEKKKIKLQVYEILERNYLRFHKDVAVERLQAIDWKYQQKPHFQMPKWVHGIIAFWFSSQLLF